MMRRWVLWSSILCHVIIALDAFSFPSWTQPRKNQAKASKNEVPLPPWKFEASRIYYQFQAIPVKQAMQYCPPCFTHDNTTTKDDSLILLSIAGYTLGGIFCVEYDSSPIGPYREVAILSSLILNPWRRLPSIGAWASHIFVDSQDAADYGRQFWGLPASVVPIDFFIRASDDKDDGVDDTHGQIVFSKEGVEVSGWPDDNKTSYDNQLLNLINLALPSFSGLLSTAQRNNDRTPLLQYPLSIIQPKSLQLAPFRSICFQNQDSLEKVAQEVQGLLVESFPLVSVNAGRVTLVAGEPEELT